MTGIGSADVKKLAEALRRSGEDSQATTFSVIQQASGFLMSEMEARVAVKSGKLRDSIQTRVVGQSVVVGPTAAHAPFVEFDTKPHIIKPKKAGGVLAFRAGGRTVIVRSVQHPGTKAQPFVRPAFEVWVDSLGKLAAEANAKVITDHAP